MVPRLTHENQFNYLTIVQHVFEHRPMTVLSIWNKIYYTSLLFFFLKEFLYYLFIYLFIFLAVLGLRFCARAFLQLRQAGATLHRGAQASHYRGLSCCGAQAPDVQAQQLWLTGPAAPRHVGSSQTRARTRVPCIGRQILNHCATREAHQSALESCPQICLSWRRQRGPIAGQPPRFSYGSFQFW